MQGLLEEAVAHHREVLDASAGAGPDMLTDHAYHAMAEAKHLLGLAVLTRRRGLTQTELAQAADRAVPRLERANLSADPREALWGLGFPWGDRPADEPYLITTGLVAKALLAVLDIVEHAPAQALAQRASQGLSAWLQTRTVAFEGAPFPIYSPSVPEPVLNVAAVASASLLKAKRQGLVEDAGQAEAVLAVIEAEYVPGCGWPYQPRRRVCDLVHGCYILGAMMDWRGVPAMEDVAAEVLGALTSPGGVHDAIRLLDSPLDKAGAPSQGLLRRSGGQWFSLDPGPARTVGLGELLTLLPRLVREGRYPADWRRMMQSVLEKSLSEPRPDVAFLRIRAAWFNGLASCAN